MERLTSYIDQLPAFKMPESHFRIGAKLHISDFYYAKRFFQNSFFATRIAFQITSYILDHHIASLSDAEKAALRKDGLTLVGYGLYSELLLSLVEQFLKKTTGFRKINHNIINDLDDGSFVKHYQQTNALVVMIVPIASTFSTSFKMDEIVYTSREKVRIIEPHINVIAIVNQTLTTTGISPIERQFGWKRFEPDSRKIFVGAISPREGLPPETAQLYFLLLGSKWQAVESCDICFHTPLTEELPLIVTDKTSLTPSLIFDRPQGRPIAEHNRRTFSLIDSELRHGHFKRAHNHYLFYIQIERFFERNKAPINTWLKKIKTSKRFKTLFQETDQVVMIAPGHYSNAGFVNMVNEVLFSNSANILHYDPANDHIQNFQLFYKNEIGGNERKIFFVDDTVTTGSTFIKTNYYLRHTRDDFGTFDGLITLLDRSSSLVYSNVTSKLRKGEEAYFAYANLQLPSLKDVDQECPLCRERERYEKLADSALLDKLKVHFLKQSLKLELKTKEVNAVRNEGEEEIKYLRKIEGIHRIFEWFSFDSHSADFNWLSFEAWLKLLLAGTKSPFDTVLLKYTEPDEGRLSVEASTVLKLLTQSPFTYYRPIKGTIFRWVLLLLNEQCKKIRDGLSNRPGSPPAFPYHSFKDFKFLVRRAGLLNANFLISKHLFDHILLIFSNHALRLLEADCLREEIVVLPNQVIEHADKKTANLRDFNVFFTAQIKELLFLNEAKSIHLERLIVGYETASTATRATFSRQFSQLLRILNEENGLLIEKFWEMVANQPYWADTHAPSRLQLETVRQMLQLAAIKEHYHFKSLEKFLHIRNEAALSANDEFLNYLCLMNFLSTEKLDKSWKLYEKTSFLIDRLKAIVKDGNENPKTFLVIKYPTGDKNPYFFAFNENEAGNFNENDWINKGFDYLVRFLEGVKDKTYQSSKTIVEFHKKTSGWEDMYTVEEDAIEASLDPNMFSEAYDRLVLLRINKRKQSRGNEGLLENIESPQAVIGFFFKAPEHGPAKITSNSKIRFLLLVREAISQFIINHHENNEFRDWIEANNKQRTALLTGHGREMLISLARMKDKGMLYKSIVNTILLVQRFIIDLDDAQKAGIAPSAITDVFRQIFHQSIAELKDDFKETLKRRCEEIFDLKEIENKEAVIASSDDTGTIVQKSLFLFPQDILDMICFELLLNAKKNRWLFSPGEMVTDYKGVNYVQNHVFIGMSRQFLDGLDSVVISIRNSGPTIGREIEGLSNNRYHNVKGNNQIAGLALISQLLAQFELGKLEFSEEPMVYQFTFFEVRLTLYNWDGRR